MVVRNETNRGRKKPIPSDCYFFSLSYSNIPAILSIIERLDGTKGNIHIIVHIDSHRLFWQELVQTKELRWQVIFLDTNIEGHPKNPLSWLKTRQSIRRAFKAYFQDLRSAQVYFFSVSPPVQVLALIKLLSKRNRIYFLDCDQLAFSRWHSLRNAVYRFLVYLSYGVDIEIVRVDDKAALFIAQGFINQAKVEQLGSQDYYDVAILKKYDFVDSAIKAGSRIVLLDDDCYLHEPPSSGEAGKALNTLKKVIDTNFLKSEVLLKRHPNPGFHNRGFDSIYADYREYPYYVPADFIFLDPNIKFVVGGFSTTLALGAKYFKAKAISYVKLVPFRNEGFKAHIIEMLRSQSDDKITFPDSWEGLNSLLSCPKKD